ncbi:MAG: PIG-L family deacetylase [Oligoflexia bacterium]|nr:PIG-L family deacetylase [Oligoflexia bacterium]
MSKRILVLSPHPDDDVIGMGGTIALNVQNNVFVEVVYVTNGYGSVRGRGFDAYSRDEFIKIREREAIESLKIISNGRKNIAHRFLGISSAQIKSDPEIFAGRLTEIIKKNKFEEIYMPHLNDRHPTHIAVSSAARSLVEDLGGDYEVWGYETWNPIPFDGDIKYVDISDYIEKKEKAINAHKSQCAVKDFVAGIIAKNKYNAIYADINSPVRVQFAEIFQKMF